jgi:hypothetical protein
MSQYYLLFNGEQSGPFDQVQLNHMRRTGQVGGDVQYWYAGMKNWRPIQELAVMSASTHEVQGSSGDKTWIWVSLALIVLVVVVSLFSMNLKRVTPHPVESRLSPWEGSHPEFVALLKRSMHDPDSFEHVETSYQKTDHGYIITMVSRGKNSFGAKVLGKDSIETDQAGNLLASTFKNISK